MVVKIFLLLSKSLQEIANYLYFVLVVSMVTIISSKRCIFVRPEFKNHFFKSFRIAAKVDRNLA